MTTEPARRFYKAASVAEDGAGVMLDQRRLRTPNGAVFAAPTPKLAQAVAAEWDAQAELIRLASMPLTQLAFAAVDATPGRRDDLVRHVLKHAETDLLCHRAEAPQALVERQDALWTPILEWFRGQLGSAPSVVRGVIAAPLSPGLSEALSERTQALDDFTLTGLAHGVGLSGSAMIGFALMRGAVDAQRAFEAAALDDLWSLERWGEDAEARERLNRLQRDLAALDRFFQALQ
ncbi:MAG TPA: ATP12 family protein [Vitreimonas sp.]|uniref:ATP12 family chaperone protein n=1 Tax=Vitreimonas sp. TaxID=3069702 RepID=UPI002D502CB0|nr:ATP12 family protein [Vitreimonas sp.]HYD88353.1 ATP12 family protein [Vitreimonas sp.]